jgi:hypothetical protein
MADETAAGAAEARAQPKRKRCRDRSNEPWYASRSSSINVPRAYPNYVDMAQLSLLRPVRYDTERDMYDLLDAMTTAYSSKRPLRGIHKKMGANFGLSKTEFTRIKWSDDANNGGTGRMVASARNCARILRNSATHRPKNAPITVEQTAIWFDNQAKLHTQPTLLPATVSQSAIDNAHD